MSRFAAWVGGPAVARVALSCSLVALCSVANAQVFDKAKMSACPFTPAELKSTLGIDFKPGRPSEIAYPEGRLLGCSYSSASGTTVMVSQTWIPPKILAETTDSMDRYLTGKVNPINGDRDKARWQIDPQTPNSLSLHYTRSNVRAELRLLTGKLVVDYWQARLLKLRRLP
jgi:hypothetical protein